MKVRGSALAFMPKCVQKKFGSEGFKRWLSLIPPYARLVYSNSIDPKDWYPLKELLIQPTANLLQLFYNWDFQGAWELGRMSAEYSLRGLYKVFFRLNSPGVLISKASEILPTYYEPSTMQLIENSPGLGVVRITRFPEIDKILEYRIAGWMEAAMEISGCTQVRVEIPKSLTQLDPYSEFRVTWKTK